MNLSSRDTISFVQIGKQLKVVEFFIEFKQFRCAPILLSCFYRPPDFTVSFFDSLANIVNSIAAENKEVHIVVDCNVDLIKKSTSESK
ncbi:unnamed protein product [Pocillopora meandrina]|uniref:Uncharacterized protein n=1 Tax=Pocillopora meandrina TaxID=46732 RepID=A0AAU9VSU7_9CNID|nr:unnamed protein product [Pocillopora meandrina]